MQIRRFIERIKKISFMDWRILSLLVLGAFFQGIAFVSLDVGVLPLFLNNHGLLHIGFDFLCIAIVVSFVGRLTVKLDRQNGYGGVPIIAILIGLLFVLIRLINNYGPASWLIQLLLIYRYVAPIIITAAFWNIARRFITLRFTSYKFLGIFAAELLGFTIGGLSQYSSHSDGVGHLSSTLLWLVLLCLVLKILVLLLPVPSESFVRKSGGVQDANENKMVIFILWMSFLYIGAKYLADFLFFDTLVSSNTNIGKVIAVIYTFQGIIGLIILRLSCCISYLYTLLSGLWCIILSLGLIGVGIFLGSPSCVYIGITLCGIIGNCCWPYFLTMLPRLLILGKGRRLRWRRQVIVEPLSIFFVGAVILTLPIIVQAALLILMSVFLGTCILISLFFYSQLLFRMCQMRRWCGGPLMIFSEPVLQYVLEGCVSSDVNDAIYFLRVLQQADSLKYTPQLIQALRHPDSRVRLFALDKLDFQGVTKSLIALLNKQMLTDKDSKVKERILAMIIRFEGAENPKTVFHKYGHYLDDKKWEFGAILGFLQIGGDCTLLAMDGLQQMTQSNDIKQNLKALEIINYMPKTGFVRLILPLLKSSSSIVQAHALYTAGKIGHVQALTFVLNALDMPKYQEKALEALQMYGTRAFPPIEKMIANPYAPLERRRKLILFLQTLPSGEGKQILLRNVNLVEPKLRKDILRAILNSNIVCVAHKRRKELRATLKRDIHYWNWLNRCYHNLQQAPDSSLADTFWFLARSFEDAACDARLMVLYQLMLLYPNSLVERSIKLLLSDNPLHQIAGISFLQDLIPNKLYQKLLPLLNNQTPKVQGFNKAQAIDFLKKLIVHPPYYVDRWVQACAIAGLKQEKKGDLIPIFKQGFQTPWPIVWEATLNTITNCFNSESQKIQFLKEVIQENPNITLHLYLKEQENI